MLPFVNVIVTLLHCIYLMQSLHHTLLDLCKYIIMQSSLWQMVPTRTSKDPILNIPEGFARLCVDKPRVAMHHLYHLALRSA
jgi:hypothetical protein